MQAELCGASALARGLIDHLRLIDSGANLTPGCNSRRGYQTLHRAGKRELKTFTPTLKSEQRVCIDTMIMHQCIRWMETWIWRQKARAGHDNVGTKQVQANPYGERVRRPNRGE